jgi:hypothetical protein
LWSEWWVVDGRLFNVPYLMRRLHFPVYI